MDSGDGPADFFALIFWRSYLALPRNGENPLNLTIERVA
ncbi:hypothetical protein FBZ94_106200 [Bradyrhizobium sacchari]|uniref:Uncharacterized protein n=1 Tax=Bradyrhizobium sacchari TaxID=1399419 RepID=A0A560IFL3_9BRAD|nr:hypothetical protein FBZ94_106200 [Bradyrhizobium sacchari]TWB71218.1 hypothetical protein FBZ95_107200 [Bradyrhizobium sacchari]